MLIWLGNNLVLKFKVSAQCYNQPKNDFAWFSFSFLSFFALIGGFSIYWTEILFSYSYTCFGYQKWLFFFLNIKRDSVMEYINGKYFMWTYNLNILDRQHRLWFYLGHGQLMRKFIFIMEILLQIYIQRRL